MSGVGGQEVQTVDTRYLDKTFLTGTVQLNIVGTGGPPSRHYLHIVNCKFRLGKW